MKKLLLLIVLLTNFLQVSIAAEATTQASPYQVIEVTGNKLFAKITDKQDALKKFPDLMLSLIHI